MEALKIREINKLKQFKGSNAETLNELKNQINKLMGEIETTFEEMSKVANLDSLTQLPRREILEEVIKNDLKAGKGGAFLLLDIDHFKYVNDTFGHPFGDRVIRGVAKVMRKTCEGQCSIARLGGEEFGIWLPGATEREARAKAERIRASVATCPIVDVPVTVSLGWTCSGSKWADYYENADLALYEAKARGRNRVCHSKGNS